MNMVAALSAGGGFFVKGRNDMSGEDIFGMIMIIGLSLLCGGIFLGIGIRASCLSTPIGFWTGKEVKSDQITDIPSYNRENARMWKQYSMFYFVACGVQILTLWIPALDWLPCCVLTLACTAGIWWLIRRYREILWKYSV